MDFVELAAIDNDRYIIYGNDGVAAFDNDSILVINLNTLTKMHPDSEEFKSSMEKISQCLPHMMVRLADPEDVALFEELKGYFYNPIQVHGYGVKDFFADLFDFTTNEPLKRAYESLDAEETQMLDKFLKSNSEDIDRLNREIKKLNSPELNKLLEEMNLADGDVLKKVYEVNILDLVDEDSPLKPIIKKTFDLAKDDEMRDKLKPVMTQIMGEAYKNVYYSSKTSNLYIFTDPRLKKANKAEWWPQKFIDIEGWKKLYNTDEDFKKTVDNNKLRPKNARMWSVPIDNLIQEKEITDIVMENQSKLRGHEMKKGLEPWFKEQLGTDYLDMFIEPGSHEDRKLYVFLEPEAKSKINQKWWPKKPISNADYVKLSEQWDGFANIDQQHYGADE